MLKLRRATVVEAGRADGLEQELVVRLQDGSERPAVADVRLVGASEAGDELIVNVQALDLGLGSGGFDVVHANLTRGLHGEGMVGGHVMKLNYTSLQHAIVPVEEGEVAPVEEGEEERGGKPPPQTSGALTGARRAGVSAKRLAGRGGGALGGLLAGRPVAVIALHGQLAPFAWAFAQAAPGRRLGFVQTPGGALPGGRSRAVRELRERGLLDGHISAGACFGGELEAVTTAGALAHALVELSWDAAVCGPGPGIVGSGSLLGHGGMQALDSAHTALALGASTLVVARMSSADERERHRRVSHHTRTVLQLLLAPVVVALPDGSALGPDSSALGEQGPAAGDVGAGGADASSRHEWRRAAADLRGYARSGLPSVTMGRTIEEDPLFFAAALAGGAALAQMLGERARRDANGAPA